MENRRYVSLCKYIHEKFVNVITQSMYGLWLVERLVNAAAVLTRATVIQ
jgi:hypothetical protein